MILSLSCLKPNKMSLHNWPEGQPSLSSLMQPHPLSHCVPVAKASPLITSFRAPISFLSPDSRPLQRLFPPLRTLLLPLFPVGTPHFSPPLEASHIQLTKSDSFMAPCTYPT